MPHNVRNFWLDASIDGRESRLSGGPRRKHGGMQVYYRQRANGQITCPVTISSYADDDGRLYTLVEIERTPGGPVERININSRR